MKSRSFFISFALISFLFCFVYALPIKAVNVSVTGVSVSPTSETLTVGITKIITATVAPSNATNKSVTWLSSNTAVATVSSTGTITAKSAGNASVTCRTIDGNKTATCSVTVAQPPASVSVSPINAVITTGTTKTIIATVLPLNATDKSVIWSSSNTAVATVSIGGVVTGVSFGSAIITCKTADGSKTATCTVMVPPVFVTGVSVSPTSESIAVGTSKTIIATVLPSNATNKSVAWSSSNTAVAMVSYTGVVTGRSGGDTTITCKTVDGSKTDTCLVSVIVPVASVSLSSKNASLTVGETKRLTFTILPSNATDKGVTWSSTNPDIATVSTTGLVTANSGGDTIIACKTTGGNKVVFCFVTVMDDSTLTVIEPNNTMFVQVGEKVSIKAVSKSASRATFRLGKDTPIELTKSGTSFSGIWTVDVGSRYTALNVGGKYNGFNKYWIEADSNVSVAGDYAVLMLLKGNYQNTQPSLDWSSPTDTPFLAPLSPEYNCLAYCVNVQNLWYDRNRNNGPPSLPTEVTKFMLKQHPYDTRIGTAYTKTCDVTEYPMAIYYSKYHFAKATSWNSDGTPKTIEYKLGKGELIKTSGYDVYTNASYGRPELYFK